MRPIISVLFLLNGCLLASPASGLAQTGRPVMEYGTVAPEDFASGVYDGDSSASAVILFDRGEVSYDPSYGSQGYCVTFQRHTRIRLLNRNAFSLASFGLSTYRKGKTAPTLEYFEGATYNLENGRVVPTKVDKSNIFKEKDDNYNREKIAFPDVREGSIIEYNIRIIYPGIGYIPSWSFQGAYPVRWSELDVTIPLLADYYVKTQGYQHFVIDSTMSSTASFPVNFLPGGGMEPFRGIWSGQTVRRIWAEQDVPALGKKEVYTTTLANHISKISFQLLALHANGVEKTYRSSWSELSEELLKSPRFGADLRDRNRWMDGDLKKVLTDSKPTEATARQVYAYVRDHIHSTPIESIYTRTPIRKIWEDQQGDAPGINLLLTAIYLHLGFQAEPVILSTRGHGYAVDTYPILGDYDYVVTRLRIGDQSFLLDASKDNIGFGQLPESCYNGRARVIGSIPDLIDLSPDSVTETRLTQVRLFNTDSGYVGTYQRTPGAFEAMEVRSRMKKEKPDDFFNSIKRTTTGFKQVNSYGFDSLDRPGALLSWHYEMRYRFTDNRYYFNPILHERLTTNPFNAPFRHYPVEIPYRIDNVYTLHMEVPHGYTVEDLPKSQRFVLGNGGGFFEYVVQQDSDLVQLRIELHLLRSVFPVEEYAALRDFYKLIVNKEGEPFVFKKSP